MSRLLGRKKEVKVEAEQVKQVSLSNLDALCGDDKEVCKALWHTMFLDPRKIGISVKDAAKKAADFEKEKDVQLASSWFHIAGGLALWKGDAAKVKQYFSKCAKLAPEMDYELITQIPDRAVTKAEEFYQKFLK